MKRKKTLLILVIVLAVISAGAFGLSKYETKKEQLKTSGDIVFEFDPEDVTNISWTYSKTSYAFSKVDDSWTKDGDSAFPVKQSVIEDLLEDIEDYVADFIIEGDDFYSEYGLSSPTCTINLTLSDGTAKTISFGGYSTMDEERYFSIGDGNAYLAKTDVAENFALDEADYIQLDELPSFGQTQSFTISGSNSMEIVYKEDGEYSFSEGYTYYYKDGSSYKALDTSKATTFIKQLSNISLTDYVSYSASTDDLSKYALDNPDVTLTLGYTNSETEETDYFTLYMSETDDTVYAMIDGSEIIYKSTASLYESFTEDTYDNLRTSKVVNIEPENLTKFEVSLDGENYSFTVSINKDKDAVSTFNDEEVSLDDLIDLINDIEIEEFSDEKPEKKLQLGLMLHKDSTSYPSISIKIYQYNSEQCLVVVDSKTLGLMDRSSAVDLCEGINSIILQ